MNKKAGENQYLEKTAGYQSRVEALLEKEKETLSLIEQQPAEGSLKRLGLAEDMLNLASNYMVLNGVSQAMMDQKNEIALNEARKSLYKGVIYLENTVTAFVDAAFSEYEDKLALISTVSAAERFRLIKKTALAIKLLENAYGENSKWKWSFVDLEGRFAAVAKNILDLKKAAANTDYQSADYEPIIYHIRLIKKLLTTAAGRYRDRYELSTNRIEDFKQGLNFLNALKRILFLLGEKDETEAVKKKSEAWAAKLDMDMKSGKNVG